MCRGVSLQFTFDCGENSENAARYPFQGSSRGMGC